MFFCVTAGGGWAAEADLIGNHPLIAQQRQQEISEVLVTTILMIIAYEKDWQSSFELIAQHRQ